MCQLILLSFNTTEVLVNSIPFVSFNTVISCMQVTKEGLAARVVDRQQIYRTMSKEEIQHLFEYGSEESTDMPDQSQEKHVSSGQPNSVCLPLSSGASPSNKIMESLLRKHSR